LFFLISLLLQANESCGENRAIFAFATSATGCTSRDVAIVMSALVRRRHTHPHDLKREVWRSAPWRMDNLTRLQKSYFFLEIHDYSCRNMGHWLAQPAMQQEE
jgi:hypothetical protein